MCLHLRGSKHHLNSITAQSTLRRALRIDLGTSVELTVTEDDNLAIKHPWNGIKPFIKRS
ncbi:DNA polymerase III subunit gamma/tau C-terminal domain-containing protein [Sodalis endosymbiont of Henestaris halophilus]